MPNELFTPGHPLKWEEPEELEVLINEYFKDRKPEDITLTGLCLALDSNKVTLAQYQKRPKYKHLVEMAKLRIENAYEISLRKTGRSGDIFALKNFGWSDNRQVEVKDVTDYEEQESKIAKYRAIYEQDESDI